MIYLIILTGFLFYLLVSLTFIAISLPKNQLILNDLFYNYAGAYSFGGVHNKHIPKIAAQFAGIFVFPACQYKF